MNGAERRMRAHSVARPAVILPGLLVGAFALVSAFLLLSANGQDGRGGVTIAPGPAPPLKYVPAEERARLSQEQDLKDRTRLSIELAEARLARAEQQVASSRFDAASGELGIYQALVEDAMQHLRKEGVPVGGKVPNKIRDIYKRIELVLRAHGPRLETLRRSSPSEEAVNVRAVFEYTRLARAEALNSFYGETVLREGTSQKEKASDAERSKEATPPTP